jgi:hypothetical protein
LASLYNGQIKGSGKDHDLKRGLVGAGRVLFHRLETRLAADSFASSAQHLRPTRSRSFSLFGPYAMPVCAASPASFPGDADNRAELRHQTDARA